MTVEYRAYLAHKKEGPPVWADDILAHYGIKGQKWGVRNYQYAEGGYTPAGAERYWGGTGQGRRRTAQQGAYTGARRSSSTSIARSTSTIRSPNQTRAKRPLTDEQRAARRAKARKAIAIGAGIAVAAALGYAAYKGSTNLRDQMRSDIRENLKVDPRTFSTGNFKFWDNADKDRYAKMTEAHANYLAENTTRRDAIAAKFAQKTGIRVNLPQNRRKMVEARHEQNTYANFIREANKRGNLNKQISEARASVERAEELASRAAKQRSSIQNGRYGERLDEVWQKQIEAQRERLNNLLSQKRAV